MIVKAKGKYVVKSRSGKNLSKPMSKESAAKRLRQVEFYKSHGKVHIR